MRTTAAVLWLTLDELITREHTLEEINTGCRDMREGRNLRGLIRF